MTDENKTRELMLLERQLELQESFPKKWGNVIFGAMATIIVATISAAVTIVEIEETKRMDAAQRSLTEETRGLVNARTALEIYFENIEDLSPDDEDSAYRLALIAEISELDAVRELFFQMRAQIIENRREKDSELTIAEASRGLPSLQLEQGYNPSEFTVYIQYPDVEGCKVYAEGVSSFVTGIGMRAPGLEAIDLNGVPDDSEVRFYSKYQSEKMSNFPVELSNSINLNFESKVISGNLPKDILEVWIGESDCVS